MKEAQEARSGLVDLRPRTPLPYASTRSIKLVWGAMTAVWVPTGPLTWFSLHEAGHQQRRNGETALNRVVSSYASSIEAITYSRRRPATGTGQSENVVSVGLKTTPEQAPLAQLWLSVSQWECRTSRLNCTSMTSRWQSRLATYSILRAWRHASTEPLHSRLLLKDWKQDSFTVASLLKTNLTSRVPLLAYHSTCGTGRILDENSVDEVIRLANAFQLVLFRHVAGTLWSMDNELCVARARITYNFLREEGIGNESVGWGFTMQPGCFATGGYIER